MCVEQDIPIARAFSFAERCTIDLSAPNTALLIPVDANGTRIASDDLPIKTGYQFNAASQSCFFKDKADDLRLRRRES